MGSQLTRNVTHAPYSGRAESQPLHCPGIPQEFFVLEPTSLLSLVREAESFVATNTVTEPIINVCQLAHLLQSRFISVSKQGTVLPRIISTVLSQAQSLPINGQQTRGWFPLGNLWSEDVIDHLPWGIRGTGTFLLVFQCVSESPGGLQKQIAKHTSRVSNSADVGWVLIACIFNRFSGNAVAAGPEIAYEESLFLKNQSLFLSEWQRGK